MARPWSFLFACTVGLAVLLAALATTCASAYTLEYKQKKLASLWRESNVATLDSTTYGVVTESPRNYTIIVTLTALAPEVGCVACRNFEPEFKAVAYSWTRVASKLGGKAHPLHFASLDFTTGRDVFAKLGINNAPNVFVFPATDGPFALEGASASGPYINYDLPRRGISGVDLAAWLSAQLKTEIPFQYPPDYTKYAVVGGIALVCVVMIKHILRFAKLIIYNRKLWSFGSLVAILALNAGFMWNRIRTPPPVGQNQDGSVQYIAPGFQTQHGIETQIMAIMHGTCALALALMITRVPHLKNAHAQRVATLILGALFFAMYSLVVKAFMGKQGHYPFPLIF